MEAYAIEGIAKVEDLVGVAQASREPVAVLDGEDECMVVMSPVVFERILFDGNLLNGADREMLHL